MAHTTISFMGRQWVLSLEALYGNKKKPDNFKHKKLLGILISHCKSIQPIVSLLHMCRFIYFMQCENVLLHMHIYLMIKGIRFCSFGELVVHRPQQTQTYINK